MLHDGVISAFLNLSKSIPGSPVKCILCQLVIGEYLSLLPWQFQVSASPQSLTEVQTKALHIVRPTRGGGLQKAYLGPKPHLSTF